MVKMKIIKFYEIILKSGDLIINKNTLKWCHLPYPNHPLGCMNILLCMDSKPIWEIADAPFIFVGAKCDFKSYIKEMKELHPNWSERQLKNCLYWQRNIDNRLLIETRKIMWDKKLFFLTQRPEAHRIDVLSTMKNLGYDIERNPENIVWKINLIGAGKSKFK